MMPARFHRLLACLLAAVSVRAADPPDAAAPLSLELDRDYVDGSFGFSIAPPVTGDIRRQKRLAGVSDINVVQFANEARRWSLTVRVVTTTQNADASAIVTNITQELGKHYSDVQVLRSDEVQIDARPGVRYAASFNAPDGTGWLRQQAVITTNPTEYYALVFITLLADRPWAEKIFDKVTASFRILRTEAMTRRIEEALQRGRRLLESIGDGRVNLSERIVPESYMRFIMEGKDIGTVQISERTIQHKNRPGVQIYEAAWLFNKDRSVTNLQHDMHLTDDLTFEKWENRVYTLTPPAGSEPRQLLYQLENGLRQDRQLITAFMPRPNAPELLDRVIEVEPTYASAAWYSLMPRLIDLSRPELYAFSSYNAERRGMVLRTVEVIGPAQVMVSGRLMQAIKLQDSEGLLPPVTEIYVDAKGRMVRVVAGGLEMVAANKQDVLRQFSKPIAEAEATMKKYPVRQPEPARRESDSPTETRGTARTPGLPGGRP